MSTYNWYVGAVQCPLCSACIDGAQVRFGRQEFREYRPGDRVVWNPRKAVQNGGRPNGGDFRGAAWAVCSGCGEGFFILVEIRGDEIEGVEPGSVRPVRPSDYGAKFVGFELS